MAKGRKRRPAQAKKAAGTVERFNNGAVRNVSKDVFRPDRNQRNNLSAMAAMLSRAYKLAYNVDTNITVPKLRYQYNYNGFAAGIVNNTLHYTWRLDPMVLDQQSNETSDFEEFFNRRLRTSGFWKILQEADRMSMIGDHSYIILKIADGKDPAMPVTNLFSKGGLEAIVDYIPVWSNSMRPEYRDKTGTRITHYQYDMGGQLINIHPDRVITVSKNGRDDVSGLLRTNYHQLVGIDLTMKAAPEARRKNAAHHAAVIFHENAGAEADSDDDDDDAVQHAVETMLSGNQAALAIDGVKDIKVLNNPIAPLDQDFTSMIQGLCAGTVIGFRNLVGNEQGQLASEEDSDIVLEKAEVRRRTEINPIIDDFVSRLQKWSCIPAGVEFTPKWEPLNPKVTKEASETVLNWIKADQIAFEMGVIPLSDTNEKRVKMGLPPRSPEEIARLKAEYEDRVALAEPENPEGGNQDE